MGLSEDKQIKLQVLPMFWKLKGHGENKKNMDLQILTWYGWKNDELGNDISFTEIWGFPAKVWDIVRRMGKRGRHFWGFSRPREVWSRGVKGRAHLTRTLMFVGPALHRLSLFVLYLF
jgi:hypothetical protein